LTYNLHSSFLCHLHQWVQDSIFTGLKREKTVSQNPSENSELLPSLLIGTRSSHASGTTWRKP
jgi:hypothetical protein